MLSRTRCWIPHWALATAILSVTLVAQDPGIVVAPVPDRDNPAKDGWQSEAIVAEVDKTLAGLRDLLLASDPITPKALDSLIVEDFQSTALRPGDLEDVFQDASMTVRRPATPLGKSGATRTGSGGFAEALESLRKEWPRDDRRAKLKVIGVEASSEGLRMKVLFHSFARGSEKSQEQNAVWWSRFVERSGRYRLASVELSAFEEVEFRGDAGKLFSEATLAVFRDQPVYDSQLKYGIPHWVQRTQAVLGADYFGHHGLAIGDVNGDGLEDLYIAQPAGMPNLLLLHQPDGTVRDASASSGADWLDRSRGVLLIDLDGDSDLDLAVATQESLLTMENDGTGKFQLKTPIPLVADAYTLSAADYDLDGDLDIYACHYFPSDQNVHRYPQPVPHHDANNGGRNVLLRNDGDWVFTDATETTGLDVNNRRWSFAASWEDFDNDGDPDLYVANDFGRNNLFRNERGRFQDVTDEIGMAESGFGMSASWSDFNRDGWMDLYVGNMFSSAGNRIVPQDQFKPDTDEDLRQRYAQLVVGNTLFQNQDGKTFQEVATDQGVNLGWWAWGSKFADLNNDGWEDIVVSNGYLSGTITKDL